MKQRLVLAALITIGALSIGVAAQAADIRVLSSNGVKAVVEELQPQFEHATGHKLAIEFSTAASLRQRIQKGEAFDVAILTDEIVADLVRSGALSSSQRAGLSRVGIGVGFRKGAAKPDVRTAAAIKQVLLNAKSVAYTRDGASRPVIDKLFASLGIVPALEAKAHLTGAGQAPESVAKGESDLVLTLVSEILPVAGVELAGPLPSEFQSYISFSVAPSAKTANAAAAQAFIAFLRGERAVAAYRKNGMEPVK